MSSDLSGNEKVDEEMGPGGTLTNKDSKDNHESPEGSSNGTNWLFPIVGVIGAGVVLAGISIFGGSAPSVNPVIPTLDVDENYQPLFEAAKNQPLSEAAKKGEDHEAIKAEVVTVGNEFITELDLAVTNAEDQVVKNLIQRLPSRLPSEHKESILKRALFNAARTGRTSMVKEIVDYIESDSEMDAGSKSKMVRCALIDAIKCAPTQEEVILFLAKSIRSAPDFKTMRHLILAGHLAIGYVLARQDGDLVTYKDNTSLLEDLAMMKSYFRSGAGLNLLEKFIYNCIPQDLVDASRRTSKDTKTNQGSPAVQTGEQFQSKGPHSPPQKKEKKRKEGPKSTPPISKRSLWSRAIKSVPFIKRMILLKFTHNCSLEFAKLALKEMKDHMKLPEICSYLLTSGIVHDSTSCGTPEIVELCLDQFREVMCNNDFPKELMKEVVKGRQIELFKLVNEYNRIPKLDDDIFMNRDLMEAVVQWPPERVPTDVPGAIFLMQSELQWFKVLEERSDPSFKRLKFKVLEERSDPLLEEKESQKFKVWNPSKSLKFEEIKDRKGKTYWEVFVGQHKDLLKEAGKWMKETSSSCSLVAALVITVTFAAAFTVPGGYDPNTGIPIFLKKGSFMVFAIADALALFCSFTATLMFLAIVTPYYTVEDFLESLPTKMIWGITSLFLSLGFMLVAFSSALTIMLSEQWKWIFFPIAFLAVVPVCSFLYMHFPMYVKMFEATYRPMKIPK